MLHARHASRETHVLFFVILVFFDIRVRGLYFTLKLRDTCCERIHLLEFLHQLSYLGLQCGDALQRRTERRLHPLGSTSRRRRGRCCLLPRGGTATYLRGG